MKQCLISTKEHLPELDEHLRQRRVSENFHYIAMDDRVLSCGCKVWSFTNGNEVYLWRPQDTYWQLVEPERKKKTHATQPRKGKKGSIKVEGVGDKEVRQFWRWVRDKKAFIKWVKVVAPSGAYIPKVGSTTRLRFFFAMRKHGEVRDRLSSAARTLLRQKGCNAAFYVNDVTRGSNQTVKLYPNPESTTPLHQDPFYTPEAFVIDIDNKNDSKSSVADIDTLYDLMEANDFQPFAASETHPGGFHIIVKTEYAALLSAADREILACMLFGYVSGSREERRAFLTRNGVDLQVLATAHVNHVFRMPGSHRRKLDFAVRGFPLIPWKQYGRDDIEDYLERAGAQPAATGSKPASTPSTHAPHFCPATYAYYKEQIMGVLDKERWLAKDKADALAAIFANEVGALRKGDFWFSLTFMMKNIPSIKIKTTASFVRKRLVESGILAVTGDYRRYARPKVFGAGPKLRDALASGVNEPAPEYSVTHTNAYMQQDSQYLARLGYSVEQAVDYIEAKMNRAVSGKKRSRRAIEGAVINWYKKIGLLP